MAEEPPMPQAEAPSLRCPVSDTWEYRGEKPLRKGTSSPGFSQTACDERYVISQLVRAARSRQGSARQRQLARQSLKATLEHG